MVCEMKLSEEEKYRIERDRVVELLKQAEHPLGTEKLGDMYAGKFKADIKLWKSEFTKFDSYLKYACALKLRCSIESQIDISSLQICK